MVRGRKICRKIKSFPIGAKKLFTNALQRTCLPLSCTFTLPIQNIFERERGNVRTFTYLLAYDCTKPTHVLCTVNRALEVGTLHLFSVFMFNLSFVWQRYVRVLFYKSFIHYSQISMCISMAMLLSIVLRKCYCCLVLFEQLFEQLKTQCNVIYVTNDAIMMRYFKNLFQVAQDRRIGNIIWFY